MLEIGAGVLAVGVEEEVEQRAREIVMMRNVLARTLRRVELRDRTPRGGRSARSSLTRKGKLSNAHARDQDFKHIAMVPTSTVIRPSI